MVAHVVAPKTHFRMPLLSTIRRMGILIFAIQNQNHKIALQDNSIHNCTHDFFASRPIFKHIYPI